ncbi:MAG: hypothetical protein HRT47_04885 [Candidatus Caenarcaniphilales bacterium]|nr:hypothetical protein [Candidatus Caenarcaniphilales bacterium]
MTELNLREIFKNEERHVADFDHLNHAENMDEENVNEETLNEERNKAGDLIGELANKDVTYRDGYFSEGSSAYLLDGQNQVFGGEGADIFFMKYENEKFQKIGDYDPNEDIVIHGDMSKKEVETLLEEKGFNLEDKDLQQAMNDHFAILEEEKFDDDN